MALKILAVSSEAIPLAKTGGLGDAVSGLAQSLSNAGTSVTLMLPAYRKSLDHVRNVRQVAILPDLPGGDAVLLSGHCPALGLEVLLLKNDALYDRDGLYGTEAGVDFTDNAVRFAALAKAAALIASGLGHVQRPDIVHAHDWHTALIPLYTHQLGVKDVKTVLTLHNIAFQGVFPMSCASELGIAPRYFDADGLEFWGQINFLKAGIGYADLITVVSQNYAREILTPKFGCGLEGALAARQKDLVCTPNGIDTKLWNPQSDGYLHGPPFSAATLEQKSIYKKQLQAAFDLEQRRDVTLMAMGSRLTTQKMADVAAAVLPMVLEKHPSLQVCVIGQGEKPIELALTDVASRFPGRCAVRIGYDEGQAHLLHAGADMLLHGSRFEPFGLTPIYSMRYGTIPIGSRVGGMADTILDCGMHQPPVAMRTATGILFEGESPADMSSAIDRAMALRRLPLIWRTMQLNAMNADFSWETTAPAYISAYQALRPGVVLSQTPERRRVRTNIKNASGASHGAFAAEANANISSIQ